MEPLSKPLAALLESISATTPTTTPSSSGRKHAMPLVPPKADSAEANRPLLDSVPRVLLKKIDRLVTGNEPWPLFLWGTPGTGKTCASLVMCDIVPGSYYLTAEDAADALINGKEIVWEVITERRLVVLDELGSRERWATCTTSGEASFGLAGVPAHGVRRQPWPGRHRQVL